MVDLHLHSTQSDGAHSLNFLFQESAKKGLKAIVVTDHDVCTSGADIAPLAAKYNLETLVGVEISTSFENRDIHMLAYGVNTNSQALKRELEKIRESRHTRAKTMVQNLRDHYNLDISFSDVTKISAENIGRPHIAAALINKKIVRNISEAFKKYLHNDSLSFVAKRKLDTLKSIKLIHQAGGVAIVAHFGRYYNLQMLEEMVDADLDGIEIQHPSHTLKLKTELDLYCKRHNLLRSGGSDFHFAKNKMSGIGSQHVPYEYFEEIKNKLSMAV
jgi:hypothetical protein